MIFNIELRNDGKEDLPKKFDPHKNQRVIRGGVIHTVSPSRNVEYYSKTFCFLMYRKYVWGFLPRVGTKNKTNSNIWITEHDSTWARTIMAKDMIKMLEFIKHKNHDEKVHAAFAWKDTDNPTLILEEEYASGKLVLPILEAKKNFYTIMDKEYELNQGGTDIALVSYKPWFYLYGCPFYHQPNIESIWEVNLDLLKAIALRDEIETT